MPPVAVHSAPNAAIDGADVTTLGFDVAAINESGQVAGTANGRAVLWTLAHGTQELGTLGGGSSQAYAINKWGQIAGASTTAIGDTHAFLWTPGQGMQDLGTLGTGFASTARGINDAGQVVGEVSVPPCPPCGDKPDKRAFLWTPGQGMQDLGLLQGQSSAIAYDINNAGQVVGQAFFANRLVSPPTDREYFSRAFLWAPGQGMRDIGDLGGGSIAYAINDAGQVVGKSWLSSGIPDYGTPYRAFVWTSDQGMRSLGTLSLGPSASAAYGINEAGQVVGVTDIGPYFLGYEPLRGFLWTAANGMEAITPTTSIRTPRGVNDRQQVIGNGRVATVQLATGNNPPVPLPGGPYFGVEGSSVALALSATDIDDVSFVYNVGFGDGSAEWVDRYLDWWGPPVFPWKHTYADDGTYTLTLTAVDKRGGRDTKSTTVTIANVAPTIVAGSLTGPTAPIRMTAGSASAPIALEFRDPAGVNDTYGAQIQCGNGTTLSPNAVTSPYQATCAYTNPGVYTLRATISDEDGGVSTPDFYRYVVVFDPEGAFTTGGGFYNVPGAGKAKAHVSFTVKFAAGQSVPNGTATFWIPGAKTEFESTAIEMLVASGTRAQFWGTGTLNGAPARFRLTAVDGDDSETPNAFRIELWQAGMLVFDTEPGAAQDAPVTTRLAQGHIQVHR